MHHADRLIARIIFLEGFPNLQTVAPLRIGQNIREVLDADLAGEYEAAALTASPATYARRCATT
jgi:bacterioferritin